MAIILEFRRREETSLRLVRPEQGSLGEIIIFPGVRIERHIISGDSPTHTEAPSRRRAQRGRKK